MHINALVSDKQHLPASSISFTMDYLEASPDELGLDSTLMFNAADDLSIVQFISLCDPAHKLTVQLSHVTLLQHCHWEIDYRNLSEVCPIIPIIYRIR